ncbi:hypothetical protein A3A76_04470 [Candidatus Woesebacteria bacterium RIFCSPLOWO2_01_FULL_39_23]|uniref:ComEC/Rec2-related protein domain-containing protein n=1 Tax=Candidatus Woesebacteria bacterium RIFCSPHIGHO2_01_FULL_40_22 TaxID=1802499 RepID=A0A1F7YKC2_9BACT|nr:MAG: hypothetical protein A2628_02750 [Candidatus Woesebacteria bacterium RIFCSPHIGHO2_01_FULL_40_22]OGM36512.1 MAG: hypothetical protein A3E41_00635 [Candidatus Woesebacteria bacterium RIFCSPHIGHO2_12_FULL_38_9]OGM63273.1 MAG: hypothetical protein A3A76_04470 [Candidatus Woesebacteria bacterium RIFCSPLOWO2_01_FULL_39_23]
MRRFLPWLLVTIIIIIRLIYFYQGRPSYPDGTRLRITYRVTSEPIRYSSSQYLRLRGFKVYLPLFPEVNYGDRVIIEGRVDGEILKDPSLIGIKERGGNLYYLRKRLIAFYQKSLPNDHAALVAGMTLGSKANIGQDFWAVLKESGTAHVVVASGMNVTLIASFLTTFLVLVIPRRRAIFLAIVGIWLYALISGFDAPIVRAAVMGSVAFTAQVLGKVYNATRALFLSAFALLFIKTDWLYDLGFILSFVATLSLIIFVPKLQKVFKALPKGIRENLVTTLSAQIGVAPILYIAFGQFNVLSPLANILVLWTVVPVTIIGMISGIISLVTVPIGTLILWLSYPLTLWFISVVNVFG